MEHLNTDCLNGINLDALIDISDIEPCKERCAQNELCGGITTWNANCYLKGLQCKDDFITSPGGTVYLKETA